MNNAELRAKIAELVASDQAVADAVAERKDIAVANAINALGLTRRRTQKVTSRGIYEALGDDAGMAVMTALDAIAAGNMPNGTLIPEDHPLRTKVRAFQDLVPWLKAPCDGLDFGAADLQRMWGTLGALKLITAEQAAGLIALGRERDTVTANQVSDALNEEI